MSALHKHGANSQGSPMTTVDTAQPLMQASRVVKQLTMGDGKATGVTPYLEALP